MLEDSRASVAELLGGPKYLGIFVRVVNDGLDFILFSFYFILFYILLSFFFFIWT